MTPAVRKELAAYSAYVRRQPVVSPDEILPILADLLRRVPRDAPETPAPEPVETVEPEPYDAGDAAAASVVVALSAVAICLSLWGAL